LMSCRTAVMAAGTWPGATAALDAGLEEAVAGSGAAALADAVSG